jgi:thioesterase domain-containing protein
MNLPNPIVFLSGAGGGAPDLAVFRDGANDPTRVEVIGYPGWRRYVAEGCSADGLIDDLAAEIVQKIPTGPIRIVGFSIGGHFGYAVACRLLAQGRDIAGFCAIDSTMIESAAPSAGWKGRALEEALELLGELRLADLARFMHSKFWRALLRALGDRLPSTARRYATSLSLVCALDPILENELSMRLLIRLAAPWIASLDRNPLALNAPAILLRTEVAVNDDKAWRRRCPEIEIFEISGKHHNLFEPGNLGRLHEVFIRATRGWRQSMMACIKP